MQKIVANAFRPKDEPDAFGVAQAHTDIRRAYQVLEREIKAKTWAIGNDFTLADCAAAPALFYADVVAPFGPAEANLTAYLARLKARPSFARTLREAEPYFPMFPLERKPRLSN